MDAANPQTEWIGGTGKACNTIHYNNAEFYDHMNKVINTNPSVCSLRKPVVSSLGIERKPFNDDRMKAILADGVAIGNAQFGRSFGIRVRI